MTDPCGRAGPAAAKIASMHAPHISKLGFVFALAALAGTGACGTASGTNGATTTRETSMATSTVQHLNPDGLARNPAFSQVITTSGAHRVVYVGGQDAVDAEGKIVGEGDLGAQAEQVFRNLERALGAAGASLENIVKWNLYVVQGQPLQPGLAVFQRVWGRRPNPPVITMAYVAGLARPGLLLEIDAIAVVPEADGSPR
jgi:enamine deaminase RidA (YjgF/YER057c/UK114 family)